MRGYSFFGDSFVYVLFEDGTDQYWARSRVLEYLNQVQGRLPAAAKAALGPDATGVGWIYEYALVDRTGTHDLAQLRALQDWFLKYELKAVPNVAEVATVGGMVRQYQVVVDPARLKAYNLPLAKVIAAIRDANREAGGSVVELAEAEYMVRARGYLKSLDDFRRIPVLVSEGGVPVLLSDVARVQVGPEMRRGIADLDGEGEVVGGVIVLRSGKNAWETIQAVKAKLETLKPGLPPGVEIVPVYDRSALIERAVDHLRDKLIEEFAVVALVCLAFLVHLRSALVAVVSLPLGVLAAFIVMRDAGRQRQHHVAGRHRHRVEGRLPAVLDHKSELYKISGDFSEANDLASKEPAKLKEMQELFWTEAEKYNVLPIENSRIDRFDVTNRPSLTTGRDEFTYLSRPGAHSRRRCAGPEKQVLPDQGRGGDPRRAERKECCSRTADASPDLGSTCSKASRCSSTT